MVCAEGLPRREIKVILRLCIPCSERASPAYKNTFLPGRQYLLDWEMEKCSSVIVQMLCKSNAVLQRIDGAEQGGQEGAPTASCVQPGLLRPKDLPAPRSIFS